MFVFTFKTDANFKGEEYINKIHKALYEMIKSEILIVPSYLNCYVVDAKEGNAFKIGEEK